MSHYSVPAYQNAASSATIGAPALRDALRQMLAVLEAERQALAALDVDAVMGAANDKSRLCGAIEGAASSPLDEECRAMADAAKRLNEVNRQIRNLVSANVAQRLNVLTGGASLYRAGPRQAFAG